MTTDVKPIILSSNPFDEETFSIEHTNSTLKLSVEDEAKINLNWNLYSQEAKKKGTPLWDNNQYRLENIDKLSLNIISLSTIKYSQIRGLTYNVDLSIIPESLKPYHIATASLILTLDGYFVFGVRNKNTMSRLAIDLIGGGLQPDELIVNECKDIFRNEVKEIKEEIGVKEENILKVYGLGILLSSKFNVIFIFLTKLNLTREEVLNTFQTNNDDEMSDLEFVPEHQISKYLENMSGYRPLVAELYEKNWSIE